MVILRDLKSTNWIFNKVILIEGSMSIKCIKKTK